MVNRNLYKLVEGHGEGCDGCALLDMCDEIADSLNLIEYMCCAEEEDFEKFGGYKTDFNGYGGDDMDLWLNYVDNDYPMVRLPEVLFFYRIKTEASLWRNYSKQEMKKINTPRNNNCNDSEYSYKYFYAPC